jgi:hypothetical protein
MKLLKVVVKVVVVVKVTVVELLEGCKVVMLKYYKVADFVVVAFS